ncbi:MAG: hypothetical protein HKN93_00650 [Acidimicrobiia bacterium]|nr:hypothetical protein [Acidimicrobiia bacterium]
MQAIAIHNAMWALQDLPDPEEGTAAWVVWVILLAVIVGLYMLISRTRRRASEDYWRRREAEEEARKNDPDMA